MPFIEVSGFDQKTEIRRHLAADLSSALADAFGVTEDIVTLYFQPGGPDDYAHAGVLAPPGPQRTFIKVHAFPRDLPRKREAARRMCEAAVALGLERKNVIIYFFDRPPHDVAHGGVLASDSPTQVQP